MKKFSRILAIAVLALVICFSLTACGPFKGYDDDSAIINGNSFSTVNSVKNQTLDEYVFSAQKCNGVERIKNITVPENPTFDMTLRIKNGRFKIVLVKDNSVYLVCDYNTYNSVSVEVPAGTYSLRMVAEEANVEFTFNYNSY